MAAGILRGKCTLSNCCCDQYYGVVCPAIDNSKGSNVCQNCGHLPEEHVQVVENQKIRREEKDVVIATTTVTNENKTRKSRVLSVNEKEEKSRKRSEASSGVSSRARAKSNITDLTTVKTSLDTSSSSRSDSDTSFQCETDRQFESPPITEASTQSHQQTHPRAQRTRQSSLRGSAPQDVPEIAGSVSPPSTSNTNSKANIGVLSKRRPSSSFNSSESSQDQESSIVAGSKPRRPSGSEIVNVNSDLERVGTSPLDSKSKYKSIDLMQSPYSGASEGKRILRFL